MKVLYEPEIEAYPEGLYQSDVAPSPSVAGWDCFDTASIEAFRRDGYLVVRGAVPPDLTVDARAELSTMTIADDPQCDSICFEAPIRSLEGLAAATENSATVSNGQFTLGTAEERMPALDGPTRARFVRKFMGFTANHPPLKSIALLPGLVRALTLLMEDSPVLYQEMAMLKPPNGREKPWHQDHAYFNFPLDTRIVGVWIALEDVVQENGCMFVVPGGQQIGPMNHFLRRDWQICDTDVFPLVRAAVPMRSGDILLFDSKLPHGTPVNRTESMRWAVQYHFVPAGAVSVEDAVRLAAFGAQGKQVSC